KQSSRQNGENTSKAERVAKRRKHQKIFTPYAFSHVPVQEPTKVTSYLIENSESIKHRYTCATSTDHSELQYRRITVMRDSDQIKKAETCDATVRMKNHITQYRA